MRLVFTVLCGGLGIALLTP
nr:hypothetical protein [Vibrio vulnificus]